MRNLKFSAGLALAITGWMTVNVAFANPNGLAQSQGLDPNNPVVSNGNTLTINQVDARAILHWQQFNIAPNEVTRFVQPSAQSIALNRIFDANPSQILGSLQANGSIILLNPNGVLFGQGAQVNVSGLIASSLDLRNEDFLNGQYRFGIEGTPLVRGSVANLGTIETGAGGFVFLLAPNVSNNGIIRTPEGEILLTAGTTVYLSERPDGSGFLWEVSIRSGEATNLRDLIADGGRVGLFGRTVRQTGLIQANSVREKNGRIELIATDQVDITGGRTVADKGALLLRQTDFAVDDTLFSQLSEQAVQNIELQAYRDITVVASAADFSSWPANGFTERTLSFAAGNDLRFTPFFLFNPPVEQGVRWNLKGSAVNDIIFNGAQFWLGNSGGFDFDAGRDILLEQDVITGSHSYLWTMDGGDIRLRAGRDIIAPNVFDTNNSINMFSGIRLAGDSSNLGAPTGDLTIEAGRDFLGGFTLANGDATISTGGNFGRSSVGRYPNTDPDFGYANLNLGSGTIEVDSRGSIYLGRVQDIGLAEADQGILDPANAVTLTSETGDIHLNPAPDPRRNLSNAGIRTLSYYPPSFTAHATAGSIFIERDLTFWPSLTGSLDFFARHDIQGRISGGQPIRLTLLNINPALLHNSGVSAGSVEVLGPDNPNPLHFNPGDHEAASVRFRTEEGDISTVQFKFKTALHKNVEISSGRDLKQFTAQLMIPEGTEAIIHAERDISMNRFVDETGVPVESGIFFYGIGRGTVYAGRDLDLGDSNGIQQNLPFGIGQVAAGLIDISVGRNLKMTTSKIYTYNGASISIHGIQGPESPVGGVVDVGTNDPGNSTSLDRGIATVGGGSIGIHATGDVNVNASRVATFGGGDIRITSTMGDINAGFGGADDTVVVAVPEVAIDSEGNVINSQRLVRVPGSGIFTYHPDDPSPLPPYPPRPTVQVPPFEPVLPPLPPEPVLPPFPDKTPLMTQLELKILKHRILGHDTSKLERDFVAEFEKQAHDYELLVTELFARYRIEVANYRSEAEASFENQLQVYREQIKLLQQEAARQYEATKEEHRKDWKLGDIELRAENAVVVPPAGIRGKQITIVAKVLDLQGGEVEGDTIVDVDDLIGNQGDFDGTGRIGEEILDEIIIDLPALPTITLPPLPSIVLPSIPTGGSAGGASLGGLSGSTGSISAASSGSVTTASAAVATVQEKVAEQARAEEPSATPAEPEASSAEGRTDGEQVVKKKGSGKFRTLQIRRGVVIQVEVNEEQP